MCLDSFIFIEFNDTWACVLLFNNDSFQNLLKTTPYPKFKCIDYAQTCILLYMGMHAF